MAEVGQQQAAAAPGGISYDQATVGQALVNAQCPDPDLQKEAEAYLQQLEAADIQLFFQLLVTEFATVTADSAGRMLAGIMLKNAVHAENDVYQQLKAERWLAIDAAFRASVKAGLLVALGDELLPLRRTAASVIGRVAFIELPLQEWPELIAQLVANVQQVEMPTLKHGSLEAIGYVCEDIDPEVLELQSNEILTAVCQGCNDEDLVIKQAGLTSLINSLAFVRNNMERKHERDYILQVIQESAVHEEEDVRVVALEALGVVGQLYYDKLQDYMQAVFNLTLEIIKKDEDPVVLQAIEFWSTICDEELYLLEELEDAQAAGLQPERAPQNYVRGALQYLVPLLTDTLTKQDDEPDEDEWTPAMAAGTCLSLVSQVVGDEVVQHVMPFVQRSITSEDWKHREAATLAFGSILDGPPNSDAMVQLIQRAIPLLTQQMKDQVSYVKDTTSWTLGRILEIYGEDVVTSGLLPSIATELLGALDDEPKIAATSCWAIHNLAVTFEDYKDEATSGLSPYYETYLTKLLEVSNRMDAGEKNLRVSAYETISQIITSGAQDTLQVCERGMPTFIDRLNATFQLPIVSQDDRMVITELQSLLCGVLQVSIQRLGPHAMVFVPNVMTLCLQVFASKSANVQEESLMCIGAVADATGVEFEAYMNDFGPILLESLANAEEASVCGVAIGCLGDVSRALDSRISPYCDRIVDILLANLQSQTISRDLKPPILSAFGDLALACSVEFTKYIERVVQVLMAAGQIPADPDDYDMVDFVNRLRNGILDAFTGIIQGLRGDETNQAVFQFINYIEDVLTLVSAFSVDPSTSTAVKAASTGVLGDIASAYGAKFSALLTAPWVDALLESCLQSGERAAIESATFARRELSQLR